MSAATPIQEETPTKVEADAPDSFYLPDSLRNFIKSFHQSFQQRDVDEMNNHYERQWNELTEKYFKIDPWPPAEAISPLVNNDALFMVLYKELYYRHIYTRLQPTMEIRFESFENYVDLFDYILTNETTLNFDLPNQWLWDIIDEFIYQFQNFSQYKLKVIKKKTVSDLERLSENPEVWSVRNVLYYLESLVRRSDVLELLEADKNRGATASKSSPLDKSTFAKILEPGTHHVWRMLGYMSLIGLLRTHCLIGDYTLALKCVEPIEYTKKGGVFSRIPACYVTINYYIGFCCMMIRRYTDAIKAFSSILLYVSRARNYHTRTYQYDSITKKTEQIYGLLAITTVLNPYRLDEMLRTALRDRYGEKMQRMQRGDESAFIEVFSFACPKTIAPWVNVPSAADANGNPEESEKQPDPVRDQVNLFMTEIRQQMQLPTIRAYLKLYSTNPIAKVSKSFFEGMEEATFRTQLMCLKHKTRQLSGSVWTSSSDVDFYVDNDVIHVLDSKGTKNYGDHFVKGIKKYENLIDEIASIRVK